MCALLRKPEAVKVEVPVRYIGFDIPNEFVVGYGLDYAERYRDLPYIGTLARGLRADLMADRRAACAGPAAGDARSARRCSTERSDRTGVRRCTVVIDDAVRAPGSRPDRRQRPRTIRRVDGQVGTPGARKRCMDRKRIFRSLWFWVGLVVVVPSCFSLVLPAATAATSRSDLDGDRAVQRRQRPVGDDQRQRTDARPRP